MILTDVEVRRIASEWHQGGDPLHVLSSTGAITEDFLDFILREFKPRMAAGDGGKHPGDDELLALVMYVSEVGPRGPVPGWADMTW